VSGPWVATAVAGLVVFLASFYAASGPAIPGWEARVFQLINGLPGWLFPLLWPFMQLGNLVVGTVAGLVVAIVAREPVAIVGVVLAMVMKLVAERVLRRLLRGRLPARSRPGTSEPGAVLRGGDVPVTGGSFPSGHVLLVAAVACVVAPVLPTGWELIPLALTVLVMAGRVYVGAHNPLDVTSGLGAGLLVGGLVASFIRRG
jgi:undecaprenyl-diphosphatase